MLVLGMGFVGGRVARACAARGELVREGSRENGALEAAAVRDWAQEAGRRVVVTFPPDGETDARIAPALRDCRIAYVSTTSVFGSLRGLVDDATPVDEECTRARPRLTAESIWREVGAVVLRSPGIYGPERGLHRRIAEGRFRLPGDGSAWSSRIHVEDLAAMLIAAVDHGAAGATYVVGDLEPAPLAEVVAFVAETMGVPMPESVEPGSVHETLRADRRVDPSRALSELEVVLRYPRYRDGYLDAIRTTYQ